MLASSMLDSSCHKSRNGNFVQNHLESTFESDMKGPIFFIYFSTHLSLKYDIKMNSQVTDRHFVFFKLNESFKYLGPGSCNFLVGIGTSKVHFLGKSKAFPQGTQVFFLSFPDSSKGRPSCFSRIDFAILWKTKAQKAEVNRVKLEESNTTSSV